MRGKERERERLNKRWYRNNHFIHSFKLQLLCTQKISKMIEIERETCRACLLTLSLSAFPFFWGYFLHLWVFFYSILLSYYHYRSFKVAENLKGTLIFLPESYNLAQLFLKGSSIISQLSPLIRRQQVCQNGYVSPPPPLHAVFQNADVKIKKIQ